MEFIFKIIVYSGKEEIILNQKDLPKTFSKLNVLYNKGVTLNKGMILEYDCNESMVGDGNMIDFIVLSLNKDKPLVKIYLEE